MKKENFTEKKGLTRRDFLKGTAAGVLGACGGADPTTAAAATPADTQAAAQTPETSTASETSAAPETSAAVPETTAAPDMAANTAADGDWLGAEPEIGEIAETAEYDVVIIGAGLSGICAARAAAEEGAKVAVVEKSESFNCRSGEYALLNGTLK